jgi:aminoglycoside 6'-N-acetyltransferase I
MHIPDLTVDAGRTAVGWLDRDHPFPRATADSAFLSRLKEFCRLWGASIKALGWGAMGGAHSCELCEKAIGFGSFGVPDGERLFYAPDLIAHYVEHHDYSPPLEFIAAVMNSPLPGTPEYDSAVSRFARIQVRILGRGDELQLSNVAPDVFDHAVDPKLTAEFLDDPRHHLAVAIDSGVIVGMASGVHYVHPDKPPEMWINEVGVAEMYRGEGIGKRLLQALLDLARKLNCREAWVLTDRSNTPAMKLYTSAGGVEFSRDQVMFTFKLTAKDEAS